MNEEKKELITELILSTKLNGSLIAEAKDKLIEFYTVKNIDRLKSVSIDKIKAHCFIYELKTGAMRLQKYKDIQKIVVELERHKYAPELNCLHFKSGKTFRVKADTMEEALIYASIHLDERAIELLSFPALKSMGF